MVLKKIVNNSGKDICLPWGQWNYEIKNGGELINPPNVVVTAMMDRYPGIEIQTIDEEPVVEPMPEAESAIEMVEEVSIDEVPIDEVPIDDVAGEIVETVKKKAGRPKKNYK